MENEKDVHAAVGLPKTNRKRNALITIIAVLILAAAGLIFGRNQGWFQQSETSEPFIGNLKEGQLPGSDALQEAQDDRVRIQINAEPHFADGESEGNLYIGNPDTNIYDMEVIIRLTDSDETIYESGKIPPGYYVDYDKLHQTLSEGVYAAKAAIVYYNDADMQVRYSVNLEITIEE